MLRHSHRDRHPLTSSYIPRHSKHESREIIQDSFRRGTYEWEGESGILRNSNSQSRTCQNCIG